MLRNYYDGITVAIFFTTGLLFFGSSIKVFNNLEGSCPSSTVKTGWCLIQALSVCIIISGIAYAICNIFGYCYNDYTGRTFEIYIIIFGMFFLFILLLCSAIIAEYDKIDISELSNCDNDNKDLKKLTTFILAMCMICFIGCVGYIGWENRRILQSLIVKKSNY